MFSVVAGETTACDDCPCLSREGCDATMLVGMEEVVDRAQRSTAEVASV
jgi:hypothetical protein